MREGQRGKEEERRQVRKMKEGGRTGQTCNMLVQYTYPYKSATTIFERNLYMPWEKIFLKGPKVEMPKVHIGSKQVAHTQ